MTAPNMEQTLLPEEAAKFLGISTQKLARYRREGRVKGIKVGENNLYVYTLDQLRKADLSPRKRGPKDRK